MKIAKVKVKERILKAASKKQSHIQGNLHKASSQFKISAGQKEWHDISKVLKEKNVQTRILSSATLSFRIKGKINNSKTSKN